MQIDVEDLSKKCGYVIQVKDPKANTYNRGIVLTHFRRYEEAIDSYDKAIELRRFHENAWINKGMLLSDKFHKPEECRVRYYRRYR